jgi:hypothetical protein
MRHTPSAIRCCHTPRPSLNGASTQVQRSVGSGFLKRTSLMHQRSVLREACASMPSCVRIGLLAPVASISRSASIV